MLDLDSPEDRRPFLPTPKPIEPKTPIHHGRGAQRLGGAERGGGGAGRGGTAAGRCAQETTGHFTP